MLKILFSELENSLIFRMNFSCYFRLGARHAQEADWIVFHERLQFIATANVIRNA